MRFNGNGDDRQHPYQGRIYTHNEMQAGRSTVNRAGLKERFFARVAPTCWPARGVIPEVVVVASVGKALHSAFVFIRLCDFALCSQRRPPCRHPPQRTLDAISGCRRQYNTGQLPEAAGAVRETPIPGPAETLSNFMRSSAGSAPNRSDGHRCGTLEMIDLRSI